MYTNLFFSEFYQTNVFEASVKTSVKSDKSSGFDSFLRKYQSADFEFLKTVNSDAVSGINDIANITDPNEKVISLLVDHMKEVLRNISEGSSIVNFSFTEISSLRQVLVSSGNSSLEEINNILNSKPDSGSYLPDVLSSLENLENDQIKTENVYFPFSLVPYFETALESIGVKAGDISETIESSLDVDKGLSLGQFLDNLEKIKEDSIEKINKIAQGQTVLKNEMPGLAETSDLVTEINQNELLVPYKDMAEYNRLESVVKGIDTIEAVFYIAESDEAAINLDKNSLNKFVASMEKRLNSKISDLELYKKTILSSSRENESDFVMKRLFMGGADITNAAFNNHYQPAEILFNSEIKEKLSKLSGEERRLIESAIKEISGGLEENGNFSEIIKNVNNPAGEERKFIESAIISAIKEISGGLEENGNFSEIIKNVNNPAGEERKFIESAIISAIKEISGGLEENGNFSEIIKNVNNQSGEEIELSNPRIISPIQDSLKLNIGENMKPGHLINEKTENLQMTVKSDSIVNPAFFGDVQNDFNKRIIEDSFMSWKRSERLSADKNIDIAKSDFQQKFFEKSPEYSLFTSQSTSQSVSETALNLNNTSLNPVVNEIIQASIKPDKFDFDLESSGSEADDNEITSLFKTNMKNLRKDFSRDFSEEGSDFMDKSSSRTAGEVSREAQAGSRTNLSRQIMEQIEKQILRTVKLGEKEVSFRLNPPDLGRLHLKIESVMNGVSIKIIAEKSSTHEIMVQQAQEFKNQLQSQGMQVAEVNVELAQNFDQAMARERKNSFENESKNKGRGQISADNKKNNSESSLNILRKKMFFSDKALDLMA